MKTAAESLAKRYARLDSPDLKAIADAPEGEYLPEAVDAARLELAKRVLDQRVLDQEVEPAELPDESAPRQSRARTIFGVVMIFLGLTQILQGAQISLSSLLSPSGEPMLWGAVLLLVGIILSYAASVVDRAFWEHVVKVYALTGFAQAAGAGIHLAFGKTASKDDLPSLLQGSLAIVIALAVAVWKRRPVASLKSVQWDDEDDHQGGLARLERQGLLRRASTPPNGKTLEAPPRPSEGASALEALLAERKDGR
jgi:uncharacterized membrane protein HdeD (DUF308 family)